MFKVKRQWNTKQVAQRATMAHLSPVCQGQMWYLQKDRIKNNRQKVETYFFPLFFPIISQWGFLLPWKPDFDPIYHKTLCSLSPTPVILHIKFDQDWLIGFRDIQVQKCEIFDTQGQVTPKWVVWFGPKSNWTELICLSWLPATLMMIRSKMNKLACMETPFSHYKSMGIFFRRSRASNSVVSGPIWPKFELVRDFMHVLVTCKYKKDRIKSNREKLETPFSPL